MWLVKKASLFRYPKDFLGSVKLVEDYAHQLGEESLQVAFGLESGDVMMIDVLAAHKLTTTLREKKRKGSSKVQRSCRERARRSKHGRVF